jgi:hypothetical protein
VTAVDIRRPQAVDAAWLTRALQAGGVDAVVASFEAKAVGTGQIGDSVRFRLRYARGGDGAPASVVGKFPSADPASFGTGVALGNYLREVMFYRHLAATARISTPRWYVAEVDEATSEFVLLMEDLAPAEPGDQLRGVTLEQARLVIAEAAKLHASHWGDPAIDNLPWVSATRAAPRGVTTSEAVDGLWRAFRDRYAARLSADQVEVGEQLIAGFAGYAEARNGPRCLTHCDFRPDNMMFATPAGGRPVTVLDWQSVTYGAGAMDVGYFLAGALPIDMRRAHEAELLGLYRASLVEGGVSEYPAQDLRRDYGLGGLQLFLTAFFAAMIVKQTARGDDMFMQMLGSASEHIVENRALETLGA